MNSAFANARGLPRALMTLVLVVSTSAPSLAQQELLRHAPRWRQSNYCGVNCLYALLRYQGKHLDYEQLANSIQVDPEKGTSLEEMKETAAKFGVNVEIRWMEPASISALAPPYIVHREDPDVGGSGHYVVVFLHDSGGPHFMDGTTGLEKFTQWQDFMPLCTGYVLVPKGFLRNFPWTSALWFVGAAVFGVYVFLIVRELRRQQRKLADESIGSIAKMP